MKMQGWRFCKNQGLNLTFETSNKYSFLFFFLAETFLWKCSQTLAIMENDGFYVEFSREDTVLRQITSLSMGTSAVTGDVRMHRAFIGKHKEQRWRSYSGSIAGGPRQLQKL
jgi:hypothetical protein